MMYQALIVAAGTGSRSGLRCNKNLYPIKGKPLLLYSVERFLADLDCEGIVVVCPETDFAAFKSVLDNKVVLVNGGSTRQMSAACGLKSITAKYVLIHDGARPNLSQELIERIKRELAISDALTLAIQAKDTLKTVDQGVIIGDVDRNKTLLIQTPQAFLSEKIIRAHALAQSRGNIYSDDSSLIQHELNEVVRVVPGDEGNIKATTKIDFDILEALL